MSNRKTIKLSVQPLSNRGGRRRNRRRGGTPAKTSRQLTTGSLQVRNGSSMPVQYNNQMEAATARQVGNVTHEEWGQGLRVSGIDVIAQAGDRVSSFGIFTNYDSTVIGNSSSKLMLHPSNFPRLNYFASGYSRYAFRYVSVEYCPSTSTATAGMASLAVVNDAGAGPATGSTAFSKVLASAGGKAVQWFMKAATMLKYVGKTTWPVVNAAVSTADYVLRQFAQGAIHGANQNGAASTAVNYGAICVRYVCDFYGPQVGDAGSTLLVKELRLVLSDDAMSFIADKLRKKREAKLQEEDDKHLALRQLEFEQADKLFQQLTLLEASEEISTSGPAAKTDDEKSRATTPLERSKSPSGAFTSSRR